MRNFLTVVEETTENRELNASYASLFFKSCHWSYEAVQGKSVTSMFPTKIPRGISLFGNSVLDFFRTKGFIRVLDGFFLKTKGFFPKMYKTLWK